jgi:hypothetical protein
VAADDDETNRKAKLVIWQKSEILWKN